MLRHILAVLTLSLLPQIALAQCDPVDFIVADISNVTMTDDVRTAFLNVATKEQYEKATQGGSTAMKYGPFDGDLNYNNAKAAALKEAELRKYTFDSYHYRRILTQKLSPIGAEAYAKCLEQDRSSPGLRVWFSRVEGPFFFLKAFWVGRDTGQGVGTLEDNPIIRGFEALNIPDEWVKGQTYEMLLQKAGDGDALINLRVSGQSAAFVAARELPPVIMANSRVISSKLVDIGSGGSHDGNIWVVQPKQETDCVQPTAPNRVLLVGSGNVAELKQIAVPETTKWQVTTNEPHEICINFSSMTGAKKIRNSISGRVTALERYVVE
jgi:hypothetical protein